MKSFHFRNISSGSYKIGFSQNFLRSPKLAKEIVDRANLDPDDFVLEIGPGKGALTEFILPACRKLIAIEKDRRLSINLVRRFKGHSNFKLINKNFLDYDLPRRESYKIIGNIPFALTSEIIKKVLVEANPPDCAYIFLQKEAAYRLIGSTLKGNRENLFSLRFKPWFKISISKQFSSNDFSPKPGVTIVLVDIKKRDPPDVSLDYKAEYLDFLTYCFTKWQSTVGKTLEDIFTFSQMKIITSKYKIRFDENPSHIYYSQWLLLFDTFNKYVSDDKKAQVRNSHRNLCLQQERLVKSNRTRVRF